MCPLKNRASYRTVPVGNVVTEALAAHLSEFPAPGTGSFVFRDEGGQALHRSRFNADVWEPARIASGFPR